MKTCEVYERCVKPLDHPDLHRDQEGMTIRGPVAEVDFQRSLARVDELTGVRPLAPKDENTTIAPNGSAQSRQTYACGSADPLALLAMARVQAEGDTKYGKDNWRGVSEEEHLAHSLTHIQLHRAGETGGETHLAHALTRVMMAMAKHLRPDYYGDWTPDVGTDQG